MAMFESIFTTERCRRSGLVAFALSMSLVIPGFAASAAAGTAMDDGVGTLLAQLRANAQQADRSPVRGTDATTTAEPGFVIWDAHTDALDDAANDATPGLPVTMTPELVGSVMAVPEDDATTLEDERSLLLFWAATTPDQPTDGEDLAVVVLDTNGDLVDDLVTYSPEPPFGADPMPYETPVLRVSGSSEEPTGQWAVWLRYADGYAVGFDAWALGLKDARFAMELADPSGNYDWAPDDYTGPLLALPQKPVPPPVAPSPPQSVVSWPSDAAIEVLFGGSASAGSSPITHYTATAVPGGATCTTSEPPYPATSPNSYECWIRGLTNGQAYLVSVTAHSAVGASTPTPAANGAVTPLPFVRITVKAKRSGNVLFIDVDPNKGRGYWKFRVYKLKGTDYVKVKGTYRTVGSKETRTLNLKKGTYVVQVLAKYGHLTTWSQPVTLRK